MVDKVTEAMRQSLYSTIIKAKTVEECKMLLDDLCTKNEIDQMAQRVYAAKLLMEGNTYSKVIAETDISSATLSRVSTCVRHGSGGYKQFVETTQS